MLHSKMISTGEVTLNPPSILVIPNHGKQLVVVGILGDLAVIQFVVDRIEHHQGKYRTENRAL